MGEQTAARPARSHPPATGLELIVAGYDASSQAEIAVRWAAEIAQQSSGALRVVWAWHMTDVWEETLRAQSGTGVPPMAELAEVAARRLAMAVDKLVGDTVSAIEARAEHGDPPDVLLAASAEADMLFLGSQGRGRVRSALLGSVSTRCIQEATCPVVVIPHHMVPRRRRD